MPTRAAPSVFLLFLEQRTIYASIDEVSTATSSLAFLACRHKMAGELVCRGIENGGSALSSFPQPATSSLPSRGLASSPPLNTEAGWLHLVSYPETVSQLFPLNFLATLRSYSLLTSLAEGPWKLFLSSSRELLEPGRVRTPLHCLGFPPTLGAVSVFLFTTLLSLWSCHCH